MWNRLSYIKNPDTGKRVSRLNPPEDWIIKVLGRWTGAAYLLYQQLELWEIANLALLIRDCKVHSDVIPDFI